MLIITIQLMQCTSQLIISWNILTYTASIQHLAAGRPQVVGNMDTTIAPNCSLRALPDSDNLVNKMYVICREKRS